MVHEIKIYLTEEEEVNKIIIQGFSYLKKEIQDEIIKNLRIISGEPDYKKVVEEQLK